MRPSSHHWHKIRIVQVFVDLVSSWTMALHRHRTLAPFGRCLPLTFSSSGVDGATPTAVHLPPLLPPPPNSCDNRAGAIPNAKSLHSANTLDEQRLRVFLASWGRFRAIARPPFAARPLLQLTCPSRQFRFVRAPVSTNSRDALWLVGDGCPGGRHALPIMWLGHAGRP